MAKIYGLFGSMTGKLADTVMSVRNGEQIARKYQPIVFNPSTAAQRAQRAKLKMLSQLSAVVAPFIAMRRIGSVSSRNRFTKLNFPKATFNTGTETANIDLTLLDLTSGVVAFPNVSASSASGNVTAAIVGSAAGFDKLVYVLLVEREDDTLVAMESRVVDLPAEVVGVTFEGVGAGRAVVLAYGVRLNTQNARALYGNLETPNAASIAQLLVTSSLSESDITLSETKGAAVDVVLTAKKETK